MSLPASPFSCPTQLLTKYSVVVSVAAIIILSIIGGLFKVRCPHSSAVYVSASWSPASPLGSAIRSLAYMKCVSRQTITAWSVAPKIQQTGKQ